ncbi:RnfH family protein [Salinisphaera sp. Q1T1-3]|uniref:RnfH family protein n=1 Tax=Salinisphaera sp. Q1T1-3 TaxID=2321229 RepID=UPI000E728698|nr:RnfH family protein [Salinisphaera sp. Q1T1-3]RJS92739.1 RnfH family protein [Salinisphaera sp. Q1T1-3]
MSQAVSRHVEVVLALPSGCRRRQVAIDWRDTIADAVAASGLAGICARETGQAPAAYGVYGRKVRPEDKPADGDRIEILRPLEIDPRAARRDRVARRD